MTNAEDRDLVGRIGPVEIDWPRAIGYYGGIGLAVTLEMVDPPLAVFIACVPFLKMLNRPNSTLPARFVAQALDGAAKPVGGDGESSVRLTQSKMNTEPGKGPSLGILRGIGRETAGVWAEARALSRGEKIPR